MNARELTALLIAEPLREVCRQYLSSSTWALDIEGTPTMTDVERARIMARREACERVLAVGDGT